jgi:hypothetical protein
VLAYDLRRFPPASVQLPFVIFDIVFPARFRVTQQMEHGHREFLPQGVWLPALLQAHDRPISPL